MNQISRRQVGSSARGSGPEGFTLLDLLIAVTILLTLAAIIIPKIMRMQQSAHRTAILAELRILSGELRAYRMDCGGYPGSLEALNAPAEEGCSRGSAAVSDPTAAAGYRLRYTAKNRDEGGFYEGYTLMAAPSNTSADGVQFYFMDQTGIIRVHFGSGATASDPTVVP